MDTAVLAMLMQNCGVSGLTVDALSNISQPLTESSWSLAKNLGNPSYSLASINKSNVPMPTLLAALPTRDDLTALIAAGKTLGWVGHRLVGTSDLTNVISAARSLSGFVCNTMVGPMGEREPCGYVYGVFCTGTYTATISLPGQNYELYFTAENNGIIELYELSTSIPVRLAYGPFTKGAGTIPSGAMSGAYGTRTIRWTGSGTATTHISGHYTPSKSLSSSDYVYNYQYGLPDLVGSGTLTKLGELNTNMSERSTLPLRYRDMWRAFGRVR